MNDGLFPGFEDRELPTSQGPIRALVGGSGPPLLLLHGYPQSRLMWHAVAPALTAGHTVVAADLPGYGESFRPTPAPDHSPHGKRSMAEALIEAMSGLGFDQFAVVGHDRGGRVAYRMALDQPARVGRLAVLDIVPTGEVWSQRADRFAGYWHWAFLAQPAPLPERLIGGDPDAFFDFHVRAGMGLGRSGPTIPPQLMRTYRAALDDPGAVEAMCEDYRAGATIDRELDDADLAAGRQIECPVLVLWGAHGGLPKVYDHVLDVWSGWATDVVGKAIDAGHFLAEERPPETAAALAAFFGTEMVPVGSGGQ